MIISKAQLVSKPTATPGLNNTTPPSLVRQTEQRGWWSTLGWLLRGCLPSLRSPLTVLLLFFYLSLLVTFIFFSLFVMDAYHVVASSRANRIKAEMQNIRNEQEIARKLYDGECVWDNIDWYRKPAAFFRFTRTSDGHLVGDTRCQEVYPPHHSSLQLHSRSITLTLVVSASYQYRPGTRSVSCTSMYQRYRRSSTYHHDQVFGRSGPIHRYILA